MTPSEADKTRVERFRQRIAKALAASPGFGAEERADRADGSVLASRFPVAAQVWIEACVRPAIPQLRAGIVTDSRWISEDLEQAIEDSGDTMPEFVELGFEEAGLDWRSPTVEHYRDQGTHFYFSTGFELASLSELDQEQTFDKLKRMCLGYYEAFRPALEKMAPSQ